MDVSFILFFLSIFQEEMFEFQNLILPEIANKDLFELYLNVDELRFFLSRIDDIQMNGLIKILTLDKRFSLRQRQHNNVAMATLLYKMIFTILLLLS